MDLEDGPLHCLLEPVVDLVVVARADDKRLPC